MYIHDKEREDLETHVSLCAERYQNMTEKFTILDARLSTVEVKVDQISKAIQDSSHSMRAVIIGTSGTVVASILGLIATILLKF